MSLWNDFLDILKEFGPALGVLAISYFRDQAVMAKNKQRIAELEKKMLENKTDVQKEDAGLSSTDIINKYAGKKP